MPPILTRALDYNTPSDINSTGAIPVINGTVNGTTSWLLTSLINTVGTDALTYTQFTYNPTTVQTTTLTNTHFRVGNSSNIATDVAMSGDATLANTGAVTLNTVAINKGGTGAITAQLATQGLSTWFIPTGGHSNTVSSVSSGTTEVQLASITIPAGSMGANGTLRVTTNWSYTNSGNTKTFRVRFGGSSGTGYLSSTATTTATARDQKEICNNNATNSQKGYNSGFSGTFNTSSSAFSTGSIDTTSSTTVYISGQTASSGETITLESFTVELLFGA